MGVVVVKCGGGVAAQPVCADLATLATGHRVLVHGGAPEIATLASQMGVESHVITSPTGVTSRHTDAAMLDVVTLAMTGRAKPRLLQALAAQGVPAIGLTGLDAGLLRAKRKSARRAVRDGRTVLVRDDLSGRVTSVRGSVLHVLLDAGFVPVVSPPAVGEDGDPVNVDADRVAAAIAVELSAEHLILLTAAPGLLRDVTDEHSVLRRRVFSREGAVPQAASGGMHRKLVAAREALIAGVPRVTISDGRRAQPVIAALNGAGTSLEVR